MAQWAYRQIQIAFTEAYTVKVGNRLMSPLCLFSRSLVEFAATLVSYKRKKAAASPVPGCSPKRLEIQITGHITSEYPELLPYFEHLLKKDKSIHFQWSGPPLEISKRDSHHLNMEADDFEDIKVFEFGRQEDHGHEGSESDVEGDIPLSLQQKRKHPLYASDDSGELCDSSENFVCSHSHQMLGHQIARENAGYSPSLDFRHWMVEVFWTLS